MDPNYNPFSSAKPIAAFGTLSTHHTPETIEAERIKIRDQAMRQLNEITDITKVMTSTQDRKAIADLARAQRQAGEQLMTAAAKLRTLRSEAEKLSGGDNTTALLAKIDNNIPIFDTLSLTAAGGALIQSGAGAWQLSEQEASTRPDVGIALLESADQLDTYAKALEPYRKDPEIFAQINTFTSYAQTFREAAQRMAPGKYKG